MLVYDDAGIGRLLDMLLDIHLGCQVHMAWCHVLRARDGTEIPTKIACGIVVASSSLFHDWEVNLYVVVFFSVLTNDD